MPKKNTAKKGERAMTDRHAVAIVGAGVAGLLAGRLLAAAGADVAVYDERDGIPQAGTGLSLWPNATRALRKAGVLEPLLRGRCQSFTQVTIRSQEGLRLAGMTILGEDGAPAVGVTRYALLTTIADGLDPRRIRFRRRCVGVTDEGGFARIRFADGETAEADVVLMADGIRTSSYPENERPALRYQGYTTWRGLADLPKPLTADEGFELWGRGRRFGCIPVSARRCFWFATLSAPEGTRLADPREVAERFAGFPEPVTHIIAGTSAEEFVQHDIKDREPSLPFAASPNVVRIGDAAHPMTPNLGQGACMAIEDACAIAELLAARPAAAQAIEAFERLRSERIRRVVRMSRYWGRVSQLQGAFLSKGRNAILRLIPQSVQQSVYGSWYAYDGREAGK